MTTLNFEVTMKTQDHISAGTFTVTPPVVRQVLECGSPLPLSVATGPIQSGRGLPHSKTLARLRQHLALLLMLLLAWLALPAGVQAQPNYNDPTNVANYVREMLYWPDTTNKNAAAFRYKVLLYTNEAGGIRADKPDLSTLYGAAEQARAQQAETDLRLGLTNNPLSALLRSLLLDIYYDRTAAGLLIAGNLLGPAEQSRLGPPSVPTGLVIDDEISLNRQALDAYRSALVGYFDLLADNLGMTNIPPAGYLCFQQLVPSRALEPAQYLSNSVVTSVSGSAEALFAGYKDLVLLLNGLRDYGRAAVALARLHAWRNNAGDLDQSKALIADSQRFLFLQTSTLLGIFPGLDPHDTNIVDAASGLAEAADGVNESVADLETLRQTIRGQANLLGFESDFLMLVQKFAGQSGDIFDSFDALQLRLDPTDLSSPLRYAKDLLAEARDSYADYRGFQDQLESQLANVSGSAEDRLFQIVGAYPGSPEYENPTGNVGSELWQQVQSIEVARLRIQKNQVEMNNLNEEVSIEIQRAAAVSNVTIQFANHQASLTKWIGHINAVQAAAQAAAEAVNAAPSWWGAGAHAANAAIQAAGEEAKGQLEAEKERQAGLEQAQIEGIESAARVKTLLLGMNTLAVDSQEAALLLKQELGRLTALSREKADLERTIAESSQDLAGRYFADPVHHLRFQHQTMLAKLSFDEAQKWLYFMARALEYKWNTPFMNYFYLGRKWSTSTLFKLRNAEELEGFYNAMVSFNSLVQLPSDDYFDWFSVREDFFGYKMYDESGTNLAYYPDPLNPGGPTNLTAVQAFRQRLRGLTNALGNIVLEFSTVREIPGGTFFRGPRFSSDLQTVLSAGLFLDKIRWLKINLPGSHSLGRSQLAGELTYGGSSFIRNFDVGHFVPDRPDRLADELTAYGTRYWFFHPPSAAWRFSAALKSPVTMQLSADPRVPPTVQEIDIFKERSVATTGWVLSIPTQDLGVPVLKITELDDVELYFYHYAVSRQMPEGMVAAPGEKTAPLNMPFPYYLKYYPNPEDGGK